MLTFRLSLCGIANTLTGMECCPLKTELIHHEDFHTREEAHQAVFEYIDVFYNRQRKHSTNGYLAPFVY